MNKNRSLVVLLHEYRKAAKELTELVKLINKEEFLEIKDHETKDPDCVSIQSICSHVIGSSYTYANYINQKGSKEVYKYRRSIEEPQQFELLLNEALDYTEKSFDHFWEKDNEEIDKWIFDASWGVQFTFDQLMEHAIVHILRHRFQIENMLKK